MIITLPRWNPGLWKFDIVFHLRCATPVEKAFSDCPKLIKYINRSENGI